MRQKRLELCCVRTLMSGEHAPSGIEQDRGRQGTNIEGCERFRGIGLPPAQGAPGQCFLEPGSCILAVMVHRQSDHSQIRSLIRRRQIVGRNEIGPARAAPGSPDIDQDGLPAQRFQTDFVTVQGMGLQLYRRSLEVCLTKHLGMGGQGGSQADHEPDREEDRLRPGDRPRSRCPQNFHETANLMRQSGTICNDVS